MSIIRILVVDDYLPWHNSVAAILAASPELQIISVAANGLEALRKVSLLRPDLVLLDVGLPEMSGIQVARRIRMFAPTTRIIFLSAEDSADIVQEAFTAGACGYIRKYGAVADLVPAIHAAMEGYSAQA